jgi:hypothetical protein
VEDLLPPTLPAPGLEDCREVGGFVTNGIEAGERCQVLAVDS